jgi:HPt (histidine-containing phosphotransfer) domain-containing protein
MNFVISTERKASYLARRKIELQQLGDALEIENFVVFEQIGHKIHGSGDTFGFDGLSDLGKNLEAAGKEKNLKLAKATLLSINNYLEKLGNNLN